MQNSHGYSTFRSPQFQANKYVPPQVRNNTEHMHSLVTEPNGIYESNFYLQLWHLHGVSIFLVSYGRLSRQSIVSTEMEQNIAYESPETASLITEPNGMNTVCVTVAMCIIIPTLQPAAYGQLSQPIVSSDSIHLEPNDAYGQLSQPIFSSDSINLECNDAYGGIIFELFVTFSHILASSFSLLLSTILILFPPSCTPYIPLLPHFFPPLYRVYLLGYTAMSHFCMKPWFLAQLKSQFFLAHSLLPLYHHL